MKNKKILPRVWCIPSYIKLIKWKEKICIIRNFERNPIYFLATSEPTGSLIGLRYMRKFVKDTILTEIFMNVKNTSKYFWITSTLNFSAKLNALYYEIIHARNFSARSNKLRAYLRCYKFSILFSVVWRTSYRMPEQPTFWRRSDK
jgi:hypothetical protein